MVDNLEKESNGNNSKITLFIILLIFLVIALIIFQFFIYITTKESIEGVEERLNTISSVANSAKNIAELPLRRSIYSSIAPNGEIDDDTVCTILGINKEEFEQIKNNIFNQDKNGLSESTLDSLKAYILNSDEKYTKIIYEEFYKKSNDVLYSKWYANILSGVIKYHLGGEITSIVLDMNDSLLSTGIIVVDNDYNITIQTLLNGGIAININCRYGDINIEKAYSFGTSKKDIVVVDDEYSQSDSSGKPIIYIYPTQEQNISVKLGNPELLTCSYPQYEDGGWDVLAKPNGDLLDLKTGKNLYSLYWEGISNKVYDYSNTPELEGFVVRGEDITKFLEEKLSILGLSEREKEEFIIYWLPQMEDNKYNYIRFETIEEIEKEMPLQIEPKPDTTIRVLMDWKKLDEAIEVKEQELIPVERNGYTVVEWGASVLNEYIVR